MIKGLGYYFLAVLILFLVAGTVFFVSQNKKLQIDQYDVVDRMPKIKPDYCEVIIPPNIAPLNFLIEEAGLNYCAKIYSNNGEAIEVFSEKGEIIIPQKLWHKLLENNRGKELSFDIYVWDDKGVWQLFSTIKNRIAEEGIDAYLCYRKINPGHGSWRNMGLYQRDVSNFDEVCIIDNSFDEGVCVNCHTFCNNRTDKMLFAVRSPDYGSSAILVEDGRAYKIGTKFGYAAWHPSGKVVVYSVNKVRQFFHTSRDEVRDVVDLDSLLAYYVVGSETVKIPEQFRGKDRLETYPAWSADGRYLYFCSAKILWTDRDELPPKNYDKVKYDLVRISYDVENDTWGQPETVLSSRKTGKSILLARISPDGRWLLFCMFDYGCFPVYQPSSDLYIMDLQSAEETGRYEYRKLSINTQQSESWHSWSSNSRWIAFSSKAGHAVFTRFYISYVDDAGKIYKPFVLPQKDPWFYDCCLKTFSVPEFITEPVMAKGEKLARVLRGTKKIQVNLPVTMATPKANKDKGPWQERE